MKKYLSVLGLFARSSIFKVFVVLILMAGAEIGLFLRRYLPDVASEEVSLLDFYISAAKPEWCFMAAFVLTTILLCSVGAEYGSKTGYTLKRLNVTERSTFFVQAGYNMMVYLLLWAVQVVVIFVICLIYSQDAPNMEISNQLAFLEFYKDEFLHALLPLHDIVLWVRNIVWLITMGVAAGNFPYRQRRGKFSATVIVFGLCVIWFWKSDIGNWYNYFLTMCFAVGVLQYVLLCSVLKKEGEYDS